MRPNQRVVAIADMTSEEREYLARAIGDILAEGKLQSEPMTAAEIVALEREVGHRRPNPGTDKADNGLQGT